MTHKTAHNKKRMIEALKKTLSVVTPALEMTGVGRRTFYTWLKEDEEFKKEVEEISNEALDFAESQLFKRMQGEYGVKEDGTKYLIQSPSDAAILFYLKTKGKHRGFVERTENINQQSITIENAPEGLKNMLENG